MRSLLLALLAAAPAGAADPSRVPLGGEVAQDDGWVGPVARDLGALAGDPAAREAFDALLAAWQAAAPASATEAVRLGVAAMALADMGRCPCEGEFAFAVLADLAARPDRGAVLAAAAAVALGEDPAPTPTALPAFGLASETGAAAVRERAALYAAKLVGRLLGRLPAQE
ncbi:MAG: hypothetical protein RLZZ127_1351 [Planctomycetota bacterium]|jgi:hypothetical protein